MNSDSLSYLCWELRAVPMLRSASLCEGYAAYVHVVITIQIWTSSNLRNLTQISGSRTPTEFNKFNSPQQVESSKGRAKSFMVSWHWRSHSSDCKSVCLLEYKVLGTRRIQWISQTLFNVLFMPVSCFSCSSTLKMEARFVSSKRWLTPCGLHGVVSSKETEGSHIRSFSSCVSISS